MSALKKIWFFLLFSVVLATVLIGLFPYARVYILILLLGMVGLGVTYLYVTGSTLSLVSQDFLFVSSLGMAGVLLGTVYEIFLLENGLVSSIYPVHFVLDMWANLWLFGAVWYTSRQARFRWPFVVLWLVMMVGLGLLWRQYTSWLLPLWTMVVQAKTWAMGVWGFLVGGFLGVLVWKRHRVLSTLYTALILWGFFRLLAGVFWWQAFEHQDVFLWLQYILTLEGIGWLFGLDGALYSGIHYPFHKLRRRIQVLEEENMLSLRIDRVTRALNAEAFQDMLRYEVLRQKRQKSDLSLLAIDVVIEIDSTYYTCADNVLGLVAASFRANLRAHDVISHWGGGRFVILLMDTDLVGACAVGKKIAEVVAMSEYLCGDKSAVVSLFMGASVYTEGMSMEDFLAMGFVNLQRAKEKGIKQVVTEALFDTPDLSE